MALGLAALLDDIAALAKAAAASVDDIAAGAAKASTKTLGVIVDDAAVTPQYVAGIDPKRELPIIKKIAAGSLRNKLVFILPGALLLSAFLPQLLPLILIVGGSYLAFEGAEKIIERLAGHHDETPAFQQGADAETQIVSNAVRTDFILSTEIMVIALAEVTDEPLWMRAIILAFVALLITALVYGVVALIVKADDVGLALSARRSVHARRTGRIILRAMPAVMTFLTIVGTLAMLWVGGHLIVQELAHLGFTWPAHTIHSATSFIHTVGFLVWLIETVLSAVVGFIVGALITGIVTLVARFARRETHHANETSTHVSSLQ